MAYTEPMLPRCPHRHGVLERVEAPLPRWRCALCQGCFVDGPTLGELEAEPSRCARLAGELSERAAGTTLEIQYVPCPYCQSLMNRRAYARGAKVIVDACQRHGVWFDAGELTRTLAFIGRGGLEMASRRLQEEQAEAARQQRVEQYKQTLDESFGQAGASAVQGRFWYGQRARRELAFYRALGSVWDLTRRTR